MTNVRRKKRVAILVIVTIVVAGIAASAVVIGKTAYVVPVLMYHGINNRDKITKLSVSPESFARQMKFLRDHNYNVITLDKIIPYVERRERPPAKTVAITFDDGFMNNYKYAYPALKRYRIPATIFIWVKRVGKPGYLGWKELKEMTDSGLVAIGSHTISHAWLPALDDRQLEDEVAGSKRILEEHLGRPVNLFCYPVGAFNKKVQESVKRAGYILAVGTNPGKLYPSDDIYAIKRIKISRTSDSLFVFWVETSGFYTWIKEHRDD